MASGLGMALEHLPLTSRPCLAKAPLVAPATHYPQHQAHLPHPSQQSLMARKLHHKLQEAFQGLSTIHPRQLWHPASSNDLRKSTPQDFVWDLLNCRLSAYWWIDPRLKEVFKCVVGPGLELGRLGWTGQTLLI